MLAAIPYNENDVWLHTDASLMPRARAAWASWNFLGRFGSLLECSQCKAQVICLHHHLPDAMHQVQSPKG